MENCLQILPLKKNDYSRVLRMVIFKRERFFNKTFKSQKKNPFNLGMRFKMTELLRFNGNSKLPHVTTYTIFTRFNC